MSAVYVLVVWGLLKGNPGAEVLGLFQSRESCEKSLAVAVEVAKSKPETFSGVTGVCLNTKSKYL